MSALRCLSPDSKALKWQRRAKPWTVSGLVGSQVPGGSGLTGTAPPQSCWVMEEDFIECRALPSGSWFLLSCGPCGERGPRGCRTEAVLSFIFALSLLSL